MHDEPNTTRLVSGNTVKSNRPPTPVPVPDEHHVSSWSIRVIIALLVLEAVALVVLSASRGALFDWLAALQTRIPITYSAEAVLIDGVFIVVAVLAVIAAIGVLLFIQSGWLLAMGVQALILIAAVRLYMQHRPGYIFPLMLLSIVLVLYLNSFDVRRALHVKTSADLPEDEDEP